MPTSSVPWQSWAPPLDPPTVGGLPEDQAQDIADAWWDESPHMAAALMWEAYAATLPPGPSVSQVSTGVQNVTYSPPVPGGELGQALSRAEWHRSFATGGLVSVPLQAAPVMTFPCEAPGWWDP